MTSVLRFALAMFGGSWLLVLGLAVSGHLAWGNGLLWLPFSGFPLATMLAITAAEEAAQRAQALLLAAAAFASAIAFGLLWVLLFVFKAGF